MEKNTTGRRAAAIFAIGTMILVLSSCAAGAGSGDEAGSAWVGDDNNGVFKLLELRPDGEFLVTTNYTNRGTWRRDGDAVVMETGKGNIRYEARIEDGRLVGRAWQPNGPWKVTFDYAPAPACGGDWKICDSQAFCVDRRGKRSLHPIAGLTADPGSGEAGFDSFYTAFQCTVRLGLEDDYTQNISFPLALREYRNNAAVQSTYQRTGDKLVEERMVGRGDFSRDDITVTPELRISGRVPEIFTPERGISILNHWRYGSTVWAFRPVDGRWRLTESASCSGDSCPAVLYCGKPGTARRYPEAGPQGEDFHAFFLAFYCAVKAGDEEMTASRVAFPFPYTAADTEGNRRGQVGRKRYRELGLFSGDGQEMPPAIDVSGDEAQIDIDQFGTGMGQTLFFARVKGKWRLSRGHFTSY